MTNIIEFLSKKGLSKKQLEKADQSFLQEVYNKFNNPYKYEENEFPVTKPYLKNYLEKYGMDNLKHELNNYFRANRMNDWIKTGKFIKEMSKK